jgi:hypothetical protein
VFAELACQSASRVRANIGFGELSTGLPGSLISTSISLLLDILNDIPYVECADNLTWDGEQVNP